MSHESRRDQSFEELVHTVSDPLLRTAVLLAGDWQLAEDLVQTALTKLYVRGRWQRLEHPLAYLRRIVVNEFVSQRRRRSAGEYPVEEVRDHAYGTWREPDSAARVDLFRALAKLAATDRAVIVLRYWEDVSVADTAAALSLSPGAVRVRSVRVLAQLRASLSEPNLPASPATHQENNHEPQPVRH